MTKIGFSKYFVEYLCRSYLGLYEKTPVCGTLDDYYEFEIHHGRLCPNLDTLADKGLVEKGSKDRPTNIYTIAKRGRRDLKARREWGQDYLDW